MRVLIDARNYDPSLSGIGRHVLNLLIGLSHIDSPLEFIILYSHPKIIKVIDRAGGPLKIRFHWIKSSVLSRGVKFLEKRIWAAEIPFITRVHDISLYHDVSGNGSWMSHVPTLSTVHELHGDDEYMSRRRKRLKGSRSVIAVSKSVANDLEKYLAIEHQKIKIIPNAIEPFFFSKSSADELKAMRNRYGLAGRYLMMVTSFNQKRKNASRILEIAKNWKGSEQWVFVIPDTEKEIENSIPENFRKNKKIQFLHSLKDLWMRLLYAESSAVVVPSLYEGFSLPPLETLAAGAVPVVSSIAAHHETLDDVLPKELFFSPQDDISIKSGLESVLVGGEPLKNRVTERFKDVKHRYSAISTAKQVHEVYLEILK